MNHKVTWMDTTSHCKNDNYYYLRSRTGHIAICQYVNGYLETIGNEMSFTLEYPVETQISLEPIWLPKGDAQCINTLSPGSWHCG